MKTEVYVDAPFNAEKIKKELEDNPPALPSDVYYFYMRKLSSALSAERTVSLLNSAREEQWKAYIETTSSIEWSEKYSFIKTDQKTLPSYEHWTFHLMTDKKDTIIAQYDVAFSISQEDKRTQWYLYEDLTDDYRKKYPTMDIHSVIRMQTLTLIDFYYLS